MSCPDTDKPVAIPAALPLVGFTSDQLVSYVYNQLGSPVWSIQLDASQILNAINEGLRNLSIWRPRVRYGSLRMMSNVSIYLQGQDVGAQGIVSVHFVDNVPSPTEIFYGNLISPAPLIRTGLDEYDSFLRWRKTWQRVTSVLPDWEYDVFTKTLFIHNPIERYHAGVVSFDNYNTPQELPMFEADWLTKYTLARSRYLYGEILNQFSGAVPGPVKDLTLDTRKRDEAATQVTDLVNSLKASQYLVAITAD